MNQKRTQKVTHDSCSAIRYRRVDDVDIYWVDLEKIFERIALRKTYGRLGIDNDEYRRRCNNALCEFYSDIETF